jgi:hypothetical protein
MIGREVVFEGYPLVCPRRQWTTPSAHHYSASACSWLTRSGLHM